MGSRVTFKTKATLIGMACAIIAGLFTIVLWPLLYEYLRPKTHSVLNASPGQDENVTSPTNTKGGEFVVADSRWEGTFERMPAGKINEKKKIETLDLLIVVRDRTDDRVNFEFWYGNQKTGTLVEGTIDSKGWVEGRTLKVLKGNIAPGLLMQRMSFGRVEGKKWSRDRTKTAAGGSHAFQVQLKE